MGSCLQCRACEVVCPGFVPFGKAMEGARAELAAQLPGVGRRIRWLVTVRLLRSRAAIRIATSLNIPCPGAPAEEADPPALTRSPDGREAPGGTPGFGPGYQLARGRRESRSGRPSGRMCDGPVVR